MAMVSDYWSDDYGERPKRMSMKLVEERFTHYRKENPNSTIEVQTNPYNPCVAKVFLVDRTNIEVEQIMTIEQLTDNTEALLWLISDKFEVRRFW